MTARPASRVVALVAAIIVAMASARVAAPPRAVGAIVRHAGPTLSSPAPTGELLGIPAERAAPAAVAKHAHEHVTARGSDDTVARVPGAGAAAQRARGAFAPDWARWGTTSRERARRNGHYATAPPLGTH